MHGPHFVMEAHGVFLAFKGRGPGEDTWMPHACGMGRRRGRHARPSRGERTVTGLSLASPCCCPAMTGAAALAPVLAWLELLGPWQPGCCGWCRDTLLSAA